MIIAAAALAFAQPGEWIVQAEVPGFVEAHRVESPAGMIVELIPQGETVDRWSRMVLVQRFTGVAERLRPQQLLDNIAQGLASGCPGAVTTPVETVQLSGRPAARMRADCPRNPGTGLPETFFALAIAGASDMHVAQVAFRRVPSRADTDWATRQMNSVLLCTAQSREPACERR
jgi:hypothetical protein